MALETAAEHARDVIASSADLQSAAASAAKAFVLYRKTRPGPSLESIKRSRGLGPEGLHPLLAQALPSSELGECDHLLLNPWNLSVILAWHPLLAQALPSSKLGEQAHANVS